MTGAFSKNVGKLFSELNLVTDNLSLYLCSSQLRSQWKKTPCFLLRFSYLCYPYYNGISLEPFPLSSGCSGSHSCLVLPHLQRALHLCPQSISCCQLNLSISHQRTRRPQKSWFHQWSLDGAVCSVQLNMERSRIVRSVIIMLTMQTVELRLMDTPDRMRYCGWFVWSRIYLCTIKLVKCGNLRFRIKADRPNSTWTVQNSLDPDAWIV